jgi:quercetin dioxygenase-like cupin family protein
MQATIRASIAGLAAAMAFAGASRAQPPSSATVQAQALQRSILQTFDVPPGSYRVLLGVSELGPNADGGRQVHPGPEAGYVLEGSGTISIEGQPLLPLKAGQSFRVAPGVVHGVKSGPDGIKLLVTWVVEKGKPFVTPVK